MYVCNMLLDIFQVIIWNTSCYGPMYITFLSFVSSGSDIQKEALQNKKGKSLINTVTKNKKMLLYFSCFLVLPSAGYCPQQGVVHFPSKNKLVSYIIKKKVGGLGFLLEKIWWTKLTCS
jgi:hypothetical protein